MEHHSLTNRDELDDIDKLSFEKSKGVLLFKHSTRCAISQMAWSRFQRGWEQPIDELPVYHLDLLRHSDVSGEIAERYEVQHESPQVLVIRDGKCIFNVSHNGIRPEIIVKELAQV